MFQDNNVRINDIDVLYHHVSTNNIFFFNRIKYFQSETTKTGLIYLNKRKKKEIENGILIQLKVN